MTTEQKSPSRQTDELTRSLIKIVAREAEQLDSLLQLLSRQQRMLVEGDAAGVAENVARQEEALRVSRGLEAERTAILAQLGENYDDRVENLTLARLTDLLSGTYSARLRELRRTLLSISGNIENTRRKNAMLINRSMHYIGETMKMMAGEMPTVQAYTERPGGPRASAALISRIG